MYDRLFSPVWIGPVRIKNRVAMTSMGVVLAAPHGGVNDDIIAFYEARARGGVGLIISEICRVMDGAGAGESNQLAARNAADLQGLTRLTDTLHKYGTAFFVQLHHPGRQGSSFVDGADPVSASAIPGPLGGPAPRELTIPEIREIQQAFIKGAQIAQQAGVDGVELHGAHGYLINGFLSPYLNHRDDAYGGTFDNRLRFLLEIVAGIRAGCGRDYPLGVRLSAEEFLGDRGNDLAASCRIAEELEKAGVSFLDISCTIPDSPRITACIEPGTVEQGWKKYLAAEIKKHVTVPVISVANIKEPSVAEAILAENACDIVGVARGHLADPAWCDKARTGRAELIRTCIGCLTCFDEIAHQRPVKCAVNPTTGREREFARPVRDGAGRTVAVIGGGPAGFTAALLLQERGFHPVLFDRSDRLGGTLNIADRGSGKEKITRLVDSMVAQARASGVELRLGEEATVEKVTALSPCGVFVASGARPFIPPVPGIDGTNVVTAEDVLLGRAEVAGHCVVVGGGMTGLETAEVLLKSGHPTTVVDMMPRMGMGVFILVTLDLQQRMAPYAPQYLPGHRLARVTAEGVELEAGDGARRSVPADTVVLALGVRPDQDTPDRFRAAFPDVRVIGDAVHGGRILEATKDAYGQAFVFEPEPMN